MSNANYLSNAASFVLCVVRRVSDPHNLQHYSPLSKKTRARQVALDKVAPPEKPWLVKFPSSSFLKKACS